MYKPSSLIKKKDTNQNHCIIGNIAYNLKDKRQDWECSFSIIFLEDRD